MFAGRILVLLIPLVGVAIPLLRLLPALSGWGMRRRIFRLYGELKLIEPTLLYTLRVHINLVRSRLKQ